MSELPPLQYAAYCRQMAMETYDLADLAEVPEIVDAYLRIAGRWLELAERYEKQAHISGE